MKLYYNYTPDDNAWFLLPTIIVDKEGSELTVAVAWLFFTLEVWK